MSSKDAPAHSTRSKAKEQQHDNTPATKEAEDDERVSSELSSGAEFGSERSGPSITGTGSPPTVAPQGKHPEGDIDKIMLEGYQAQEDAKIAKELQEKADAEYAQQVEEEWNSGVQHSEGKSSSPATKPNVLPPPSSNSIPPDTPPEVNRPGVPFVSRSIPHDQAVTPSRPSTQIQQPTRPLPTQATPGQPADSRASTFHGMTPPSGPTAQDPTFESQPHNAPHLPMMPPGSGQDTGSPGVSQPTSLPTFTHVPRNFPGLFLPSSHNQLPQPPLQAPPQPPTSISKSPGTAPTRKSVSFAPEPQQHIEVLPSQPLPGTFIPWKQPPAGVTSGFDQPQPGQYQQPTLQYVPDGSDAAYQRAWSYINNGKQCPWAHAPYGPRLEGPRFPEQANTSGRTGAAPDDEEDEGMDNDPGLHGEDAGDLPVITQPTQPQNEASDIYEHIYAIGQCRGALKRQEQTLQRYEDRLGLTQNMHATFDEMHDVLKQCSSSLRMSLGGISEDEIQRKHKERLQTSKQKMQKAPEDYGGTKRKRDDGDDSEGEKEDEGGEDRGKKGKPKRPRGSDRNAKDNRKKKDESDDEHDETYGKEPQVHNGRVSYGRKPKEHRDR